jgi:hypothetical protein
LVVRIQSHFQIWKIPIFPGQYLLRKRFPVVAFAVPLLRSVPFVAESPLFPWPIDLALVATVAEQAHSGAVLLRLAAVVFDILPAVVKTRVVGQFVVHSAVAELLDQDVHVKDVEMEYLEHLEEPYQR